MHDKPKILNYVNRRRDARVPIGRWGERNFVYVENLPHREIELSHFVEDGGDRGCGFMPLELPLTLFELYADFIKPGMTVWDGFMGRGTIGLAALMRGMNYIGIDKDPRRVEIAKSYIG